MPKRKLPYREGDWFAVPLSCGGYALGLVARMNRVGGVLAYFFGPRHESMPTIEQATGKQPGEAVAIALVGGLGLINGTWRIVGRLERWDASEWPLPVFGRYDELSRAARRVFYSEDLLHERREERATVEEIRDLPEAGAWGYGFAEARLSRLLCAGV